MTNAPLIPASILRLEAQWLGWLSFLETCLALEHDKLPESIVGRISSYPVDAADAVETIFELSCREASIHLGNTGRLTIDKTPYFQRFCVETASTTIDARRCHSRNIHDMDHITRARTFSPVAVYLAIAADYTVDRIAAVENQAIAKGIYDAFSLGRNPVVIRKGCAVLTIDTYPCPWSGKPGLTYSNDGALEQGLTPVVDVLVEHCDRAGYFMAAQSRLASIFSRGGESIESRDRLPITPDVTVVFYKSKFEVLVQAEAAQMLNAFLGEWLADNQRIAA